MFKVMRQEKIKEIILDRNQIDVQTLSAMLNVSSVTIRNDLEALEAQGFIVRTHGGAVLNDSYTRDRAISAASPNTFDYDKYKDNIAQIASHLIEDLEWIFIGPGTTCCYIAKCLMTRSRLNIVTNNIGVASILADNSAINVIVTGGTLNERKFLSGEIFGGSLKNIHVSKAFVSVAGVDHKYGFSVSTLDELSIYTHLCRIADEVILLADHNKFDKVSFIKIGDLNSATTLISNENTPETYKAFFFDHGVKLFTSYEIKPSSVQGEPFIPMQPRGLNS